MAMASMADIIDHVGFHANKDTKNCPEPIRDTLSMKTAADEITDNAVTELDSILVVKNNFETADSADIELTNLANSVTILVDPAGSEPEGGKEGDSSVNIDQEGESVPTHERVIQLIARAIKAVGAFTVVAVMHAAHSEPASGLVFGHTKLFYNVTLAVIFTLGVVEFITGLWISVSSSLFDLHHLWIGGIVLFLSIWPLVGILSIGGLA